MMPSLGGNDGSRPTSQIGAMGLYCELSGGRSRYEGSRFGGLYHPTAKGVSHDWQRWDN